MKWLALLLGLLLIFPVHAQAKHEPVKNVATLSRSVSSDACANTVRDGIQSNEKTWITIVRATASAVSKSQIACVVIGRKTAIGKLGLETEGRLWLFPMKWTNDQFAFDGTAGWTETRLSD